MNIEQFRNPPKEYREVPFWSWNDDLDPEELRRQIGLMDEAGWGGFFMHSRVGLVTPYMGQRWMACIRACVEEARERGMGAWLYDEDKWPSGFAGGLSVAPNPSFRTQYLVCKVDNRPALLAERVATFSAREIDGQLADVRPDDAPDLVDDAARVIQFYTQAMALGIPWFNDYAYLDLLNPDAVRAFLDTTHEVYARTVGDDFGGAIPGVFTDEPRLLYRGRGTGQQPALPWTDGFLDHFHERNGYDLLPHLPALFLDVGEYHGVRYDYWRTITERFVESFTRQVSDWCDDHGLAFTGHYMAEDTLLQQIQSSGATMVHYPYMHVPGIDKLDREINTGQGTVLTVKQLDSVVCQTGKPRALCENYGCSGQDFGHTGRKWLGDWAYILGITLNNPHLSLYSMRGERKRDYPQNVYYQQPWWPENPLIADYYTRLSYVLSQGQRVVDILVIHPMGSAWTLYRPAAHLAVAQLDRALDDLLMTLMQGQRDFHLGDEMLMSPGTDCEARVTEDEAGARLDVGEMSYRVIVVPPGTTLAENTVRLLREFARAGGPVLALEPLPTLVEGRPADGPVLPEEMRLVALDGLSDVLDELLPFDVRVPGRPTIWAHHRRIDGIDCYFLANIDRDRGGVATVQLRGTGRLETWDAATGDVHPLPCRQSDGITEVVLDFAPVGSHLLMMHPGQPSVTVESVPERVVTEVELNNTWDLSLHNLNALTLDTVQVRVGNESGWSDWSKPMHILDAHGVVARAGVGSGFELRYTFDVAVCPPAPIYLVVESPERFTIVANGQPVASDDSGWWTDISFRKVDISGGVQAGRNQVVLGGVFARDTELESVYLVGDFGVHGQRLRHESQGNGQVFDRYASGFRVTDLTDRVCSGDDPGGLAMDLTPQGLAFFPGRVTLRQSVALPSTSGRAVLDIHNLRAAVAHVRVNGEHQGSAAWPPHRVDVTAGLRPGENVVEIELVGTLRNLLGPHHLKGGDIGRTGPGEFRDKSRWTDDYILVPFGFDAVRVTIFGSSQG